MSRNVDVSYSVQSLTHSTFPPKIPLTQRQSVLRNPCGSPFQSFVSAAMLLCCVSTQETLGTVALRHDSECTSSTVHCWYRHKRPSAWLHAGAARRSKHLKLNVIVQLFSFNVTIVFAFCCFRSILHFQMALLYTCSTMLPWKCPVFQSGIPQMLDSSSDLWPA